MSKTGEVAFYRRAHLYDNGKKILACGFLCQISIDDLVKDVEKARELVESVSRELGRSIVAEEDLSAQGAGFVGPLTSLAFTLHQRRSKVEARGNFVFGNCLLKVVHFDVSSSELELAGVHQSDEKLLVLEDEPLARSRPQHSMTISALLQIASAAAARLDQSLLVSGVTFSVLGNESLWSGNDNVGVERGWTGPSHC